MKGGVPFPTSILSNKTIRTGPVRLYKPITSHSQCKTDNYWTALNGLGEISPTTHVPLREWASANFTQVTFHSANNNIFVNQILFEVYTNYLNHTILPLLEYRIGEFRPLSVENRLQSAPTTFIRVYNCMERRLKSTTGRIFSVFAVVWAVMSGLRQESPLEMTLLKGHWKWMS